MPFLESAGRLELRSEPMKQAKFSKEQIVYVIRWTEAGNSGRATAYPCMGKEICPSGICELRRLRQLEEKENHRAKRLVADPLLGKQMLPEALRKNLRSIHRREPARWLR
jgi:hypothetical protein